MRIRWTSLAAAMYLCSSAFAQTPPCEKDQAVCQNFIDCNNRFTLRCQNFLDKTCQAQTCSGDAEVSNSGEASISGRVHRFAVDVFLVLGDE